MEKYVTKRGCFSRKTFLCAWWDSESEIYYGFVSSNRTVDADVNTVQHEPIYAWLYLCTRKELFLQQDNARSSIAREGKQTVEELNASEFLLNWHTPRILHHPADTFFRKIIHFLHDRRFDNLDQVETRCCKTEWRASQLGNWKALMKLLMQEWNIVKNAP